MSGQRTKARSKGPKARRMPPCPTPFVDVVYKVAHGVEVPLRVWQATAGRGARPWVMWFHGGGFTFGKHYVPNPWVLPAFRERGYHIVSVGYRFFPHVSLDDVLEDSRDAFMWCRAHLAETLQSLEGYDGPLRLDLGRYVLAGDSAGFLIAALGAHSFQPRPRACLSMYGMTSTDPAWFVPPFPPGWPVEMPISGLYPEHELAAMLDERDASRAQVAAPFHHELPPAMSLEDLRSYWGMPHDWAPAEDSLKRADMMVYQFVKRRMITSGCRREEYASDAAFLASLDRFDAIKLLDARAHSSKGLLYPPTFVIHGEKDETVPAYHSKRFASRLKHYDVPVGESYDPDEVHSFDLRILSQDHPKWRQHIKPAMDFVERYVYRDVPSAGTPRESRL